MWPGMTDLRLWHRLVSASSGGGQMGSRRGSLLVVGRLVPRWSPSDLGAGHGHDQHENKQEPPDLGFNPDQAALFFRSG
jgi:hypothetical protein